MRRVIVIAAAGLGLAGCSSFSLDSFKSAPPPMQVQLDSAPPGADAVTSLGPGCKTPCTVSIPTPETNFSVTFNLPKYQPANVPVTVTRVPGDFTSPATTTLDPSPVFAELQPAGPPPRAARKPIRPKKKPKA
ncbi:PEGA domain-containing protein, partial [Bradyrhizobium sp. Arg68]